MNSVLNSLIVELRDELIREIKEDLKKELLTELKTQHEGAFKATSSPYFTMKEAMEYLRISSTTTFRKYLKKNMIKVFGSNGERMQLFRKEDLDSFLKSYK